MLIIEDGSIVENSNSYITIDEYKDWLSSMGYTFDESKNYEPDIIYACKYLNSLNFIGSKVERYRTMAFPRLHIGLDNIIPEQIKDAQCYITYMKTQGTDFFKVKESNGGIQQEVIGPISTTYFEDSIQNRNSRDIFPYLNKILADFLDNNSSKFMFVL